MRVLHHGSRVALGDDPALIDDDEPVGQFHDSAHVVLDEDYRGVGAVNAPDHGDGAGDLARRQARKNFVEHYELCTGCQRARQFKELALMEIQFKGSA